jgi:hypothetical protein
MATKQHGLIKDGRSAGARTTALAVLALTLAACSSMPTGPETKLEQWDGKPVITTEQHCASAGCTARATRPTAP